MVKNNTLKIPQFIPREEKKEKKEQLYLTLF